MYPKSFPMVPSRVSQTQVISRILCFPDARCCVRLSAALSALARSLAASLFALSVALSVALRWRSCSFSVALRWRVRSRSCALSSRARSLWLIDIMMGESSEKSAPPSSDTRLDDGRGGIGGLTSTPSKILSAADRPPTAGRGLGGAGTNPPSLMSEPDALLLSDLARTPPAEGRPVTPGGSSLTTSGDSAGRTSSSSSLSLRRLTTSTISTPDGSAVNEIRGCLFDSAPKLSWV